MMEFIVLNLLLLKFSASIMAVSQSRTQESSFKNQKVFKKVPDPGKCRIEIFHSFYHGTPAAV